ncbi:hypothetical protein CARUB_v10021363mg [Capsella rubella]|uniref:Knottin scorpion toxin-like domain-containing protein n=1 Tax=Capsella rubella TaxID=81985 RepID=R0GDK5_9BRAS|nr:hypothetical protein CARUB_v10021363mg [Capsella rubella]
MTSAMKTSITFLFTICFIISFVHGRAIAPGYGTLFDAVQCFGGFEPCHDHGDVGCTAFCKKYKYDFGVCTKYSGCCCHVHIDN